MQSEPVKMEKSIIQIVPNYTQTYSHPVSQNINGKDLTKDRTYESGYDSLQRPSGKLSPHEISPRVDKNHNTNGSQAVLSDSHSNLVGSQASSLFDKIAGKNVEIGALKNQVYMLRKNLETQVSISAFGNAWFEKLKL